MSTGRKSIAADGSALQSKHHHVEQAFDGLPRALLVFDAARDVVACNRAARMLLGTDAQGLPRELDALMSAAEQFDHDDRGALARAFRALMDGQSREVSVHCSQSRVLRLSASRMAEGWTLAIDTAAATMDRGQAPGETDGLTGLLNRTTFHECLADAEIETQMGNRAFALLFIDLDRFKQVNDTLGHSVGDALLARVAERMRKAVRADDVLGRLGGDEFAILTEIGSADHLDALAERLIDLVSRPYLVDGHLITIGTSIGVALMPADAQTADHLAKCADLALYRAKADGRGIVRRYRPEMSEQAAARRLLEFDLRKALLLDEFELHYQPQMSIDGSRAIGFEALLRWNHPVRGRVSPADFVPLAEESGQIVAIGEWVMQTAAAEAVQWPEDISIAVNLSPVQFRTGKLVSTVAAILARTGLAPHRLELEVTEGVLLSDEKGNLSTLADLQRLGVKIAIDDFGTGYASLAYLKRFPFDKIKIDQSFVREITRNADSDAIVRAVVDLGRMLGMTTIAEGVETVEELERIRSHGCGAVQGYLTGRPMSHSDVRSLLAQRAIIPPKRA